MEKLTLDNFKKGFLMDDELLAGISQNREGEQGFVAFVVRHTTGENLGQQFFSNAPEAIRTLNSIERAWGFQSTSRCGENCGSGKCGKSGSCGGQKSSVEAGTATSCESGSC